jgi:hypothetical protein
MKSIGASANGTSVAPWPFRTVLLREGRFTDANLADNLFLSALS